MTATELQDRARVMPKGVVEIETLGQGVIGMVASLMGFSPPISDHYGQPPNGATPRAKLWRSFARVGLQFFRRGNYDLNTGKHSLAGFMMPSIETTSWFCFRSSTQAEFGPVV